MQSLWNDSEAEAFENSPVQMRVYTSRLLGQDAALVLHGGGNTSVKAQATNLFGEAEDVLYVKGSGWDLATIEAPGFAPVRMDALLKMAQLEELSDTEMVRAQRAAMTDPYAPNPSVEAILHAIIPFKYVDHTHADAAVAVTNTPGGEDRIKEIYGDRVLIIPYVMPGFILAQTIYTMTRDTDWSKYEGMILMNHGVFTFSDDARESYELMIKLVTEAEEYLAKHDALEAAMGDGGNWDSVAHARLRRAVSELRGVPMLATLNDSPAAQGFAGLDGIADTATRGPLTPDHVIRTKRVPLMVGDDVDADAKQYADDYTAYFERLKTDGLTCLDTAPRWAVWPGNGTVAFGRSVKETGIITDIIEHTTAAIQWAEHLGGWRALPENDIFEVEYWELEQAKLAKGGSGPVLQGRVALVTGAASGIGKACTEALLAQGANVIATDLNADVADLFNTSAALGVACDVTDAAQMEAAVEQGVRAFGGLDILVCNAGILPPSAPISEMDEAAWQRSLDINLTSNLSLFKLCVPYLEQGWEPAIVIVGSKNVPAPGPGAGAYSVAKAGLNQLARVAALELGGKGIRVNSVHPNMVFDTGIWTEEVLAQRAAHYGVSVEEYKTNNLLCTDVRSTDVADMVVAMAGPLFSRTTAAQVPIDGGNDRVV
jgi:rhamnose utilization protein RhaD (predicted bifunctional aldolase and dehydrogenase)/NAD(P)-dependent dehydrogenase (short-subunit alcohol dehydrogenase family)